MVFRGPHVSFRVLAWPKIDTALAIMNMRIRIGRHPPPPALTTPSGGLRPCVGALPPRDGCGGAPARCATLPARAALPLLLDGDSTKAMTRLHSFSAA